VFLNFMYLGTLWPIKCKMKNTHNIFHDCFSSLLKQIPYNHNINNIIEAIGIIYYNI